MIKIPDAKVIHDGKSEKARQRCEGWNDCIAEVQRLNATAQPKCQKCGGTGMADSGGVQPWGEPILIDCDCATAQPVSDGWRMVPNEPTHEMIWAAKNALSSTIGWESFKQAYYAMLAAAPGGKDD